MLHFNSIWYLGLGAASTLLLVVVFIKKKDLAYVIHFLSMVGIGYIIEFFIYILLQSYRYNPNLIRHDAFYDSNLGAISSNLFCLPVSATCISAFRLKIPGVIVFTLFFVGVESLFLKLGIYHHYWWRTAFTALGLPVYYLVSAELYRRIHNPTENKALKAVIVILMAEALLGTLQFAPIALFDSRSYSVGWFENHSRETTALSTIQWLCYGLLYSLLIWLQRNIRMLLWLKYVIAVVFSFGLNALLKQVGILETRVWWDPYYCAAVSVLVIGTISYLDSTGLNSKFRLGSSGR